MLDVLNEGLINKGDLPVSLTIVAKEFAVLARCTSTVRHGPDRRVPTCQLHMRMFKDGDTIFIDL
jgi:succinate dehydrogenase / fumarate reductase iron-sulfur subunit